MINEASFMTLEDVRRIFTDEPILSAEDIDLPELLEECRAACAWLNRVIRKKTVNQRASSAWLKNVAGKYAGRYVSKSAFICSALYLGFKMQGDYSDCIFNIVGRNIPHYITGAPPPGSHVFLTDREMTPQRIERMPIDELPTYYKRQW